LKLMRGRPSESRVESPKQHWAHWVLSRLIDKDERFVVLERTTHSADF
jgi:hypothetical protein